ncbi:MAG: hypothetical protein WC243_00435 [Patescibacteria group bacterium]
MNEKSFKLRRIKVNLHDHLRNVRNRLVNDVWPYVDLIQDKARKDKIGIGNFALIRMLFPPIETIAQAINKKPQDLLTELGIKFPYLYWSLFRDVFMHADEFENAIYEKTEIRPGIGIAYPGGSGSHTSTQSVAMVTVTKLYFDLVQYIEKYIRNTNKNKMVNITIGIEYLKVKGDSMQHQEANKIIHEILEVRRLENPSDN